MKLLTANCSPSKVMSLAILVPLLWCPPALCQTSDPAGVPTSMDPGIFGVGFTNVTDSSARLVFTTSERMSSTVVILDHDKEAGRISQPSFDEIHAVDLTGLTKGADYRVTITAVAQDGRTVTSEAVPLKTETRPASGHAWPGYTIFSTSCSGEKATQIDLLTQSGVRMFRIEASWSNLFPKNRQIDQVYLDQLLTFVAELKKRNIEPLVVLDYCAPWAQTYTASTMTWRRPGFGPPDRLDDWEFYVRTVVTALRGSARYYEVWNEPDAGYLASGSYIERPDLPAPIGRPPFKDNWRYWLGDRFVPMIARVRAVMDELDPDAMVMNGGWNRDYSSQRGDLLFERGAAPSLDIYAFHTYSAEPLSFSRWYGAIDGGFHRSIDRLFNKYKVRMPLAITEWGWPAWSAPQAGKGFVTFEDAQKFYVKSSFYFLGLERVEILSQFCLGIGPNTRDKDPLFFMLVDQGADGKRNFTPAFKTFQWLATTFGSHSYRALPVQVTPPDQVKSYAIQMKDSGDIFLAAWQDGVPDAQGAISPQASREVALSIPIFPAGNYSIQELNLDGTPRSQTPATNASSFPLTVTLPEISSTSESGIYLARISTHLQGP
jgi:hypothetical protein